MVPRSGSPSNAWVDEFITFPNEPWNTATIDPGYPQTAYLRGDGTWETLGTVSTAPPRRNTTWVRTVTPEFTGRVDWGPERGEIDYSRFPHEPRSTFTSQREYNRWKEEQVSRIVSTAVLFVSETESPYRSPEDINITGTIPARLHLRCLPETSFGIQRRFTRTPAMSMLRAEEEVQIQKEFLIQEMREFIGNLIDRDYATWNPRDSRYVRVEGSVQGPSRDAFWRNTAQALTQTAAAIRPPTASGGTVSMDQVRSTGRGIREYEERIQSEMYRQFMMPLTVVHSDRIFGFAADFDGDTLNFLKKKPEPKRNEPKPPEQLDLFGDM